MVSKRIVDMDLKQLLEHVDQTWYKDTDAIHRIKFRSEPQRVQYLQDCKESRDRLYKNLKGLDKKRKEAEGTDLDLPYNTIYNYALLGFGFCYEFVDETWLRFDYTKDIHNHTIEMVKLVEKYAGDAVKLQEIAEVSVWYRNLLKDAVEKKLSPHTKLMSRWLKRNYMTVDDLVKNCMKQFGYYGKFENLEVFAKTKIWNEIIGIAGEAKFVFTRSLDGLGLLGGTVLLSTLSVCALDVFTSKNKPKAAAEGVLNFACGRYLGKFIPIDKWAVGTMKKLYKLTGKLPPGYKNLPADCIFRKEHVSGDITAGEAENAVEGASSDNIVIQLVDESAEAAETGTETMNFVRATYNVAEDSVTLVAVAEEAAELGALAFIGGPLLAGLGLIVIEGVAGYVIGQVIGKLFNWAWEKLDMDTKISEVWDYLKDDWRHFFSI